MQSLGSRLKHGEHEAYSELLFTFFILICGVEHCGVILDTLCIDTNLIPSLPRLSHITWFVCLYICFFLIKHLLIKSWLHVCFVWLISRFSERNWHSLLITVSAYAWLLLHRATDGENTASSQKGRPASSFPRLNPPTAGSQQPPGALSPLLFLLWRCPHMHQCGGVLW